jgi:hypothetical protein
MKLVDQIGPISAEFARHLTLSKQQLIDATSDPGLLAQFGAAYVGGEIELPTLAKPPAANNAAIETFIVENDGSCTPTGSNLALIDAFTIAAEQMVRLLRGAMADLDVTLDGPSYLTASVTPAVQVVGEPHFDDEQFLADDGVGFVAVVGSIAGSRVACEPVKMGPARNGLPLDVDPLRFDEFSSGKIAQQTTSSNRISVMPQFGQMHAGPALALQGATAMRSLMVFRARTIPTA